MPDTFDPSELSATPPKSVQSSQAIPSRRDGSTGSPETIDPSELSAIDPSELSAAPEPSIGAANPSLVDHVRRFLFGGPEGETAPGRQFPSLSGAKIGATPTDDLPLVRFEELVPSGDGPVKNAARGLAQSLTGLTTGKNLEFLAATGGLGAIGEVKPLLGQAINLGLASYFSYEMAHGASDAVQQAYKQYQAGDYDGMARSLGYASATGLLAGLSASHAIKSGKALNSDIADAIDRHNEDAGLAVATDAAQHIGEEPAPEPQIPPTGPPKGKRPVRSKAPAPAPAPAPEASPIETSELSATPPGDANDANDANSARPTPSDYAKPGKFSDLKAPSPSPLTEKAGQLGAALAPPPAEEPRDSVTARDSEPQPGDSALEPAPIGVGAQTVETPTPAAVETPTPEAIPAEELTAESPKSGDKGDKSPTNEPIQVGSQPTEAAEKPETLSFRAKGNHKIDINLWQDEGGGWHSEADYNLQGFMGGSRAGINRAGSVASDSFATREEALQSVADSLKRRLMPVLEGKAGSAATAKHAQAAAKMLHWLHNGIGLDATGFDATPETDNTDKPAPDVNTVENAAPIAPEELTAEKPEAPAAPEKPQQEIAGLPHPKMPALVDAIEHRLENGPVIKDTPALVKLAAEHLGDPLTSGKYEIKDLYDAVETAVNRYIASDGRIMQADPKDALRGLETLLATLPTQTARTKEQREFQQFSTPPTLSYLAAKAADIQPGETVLEPSAGTGSLAAFAKAAGAHVETNELSPSRAAFLELQGYKPSSVNAERIRDHRPDLKPDTVLMNPPFSATAGRKSTNKNSVGYQHVLSALDTLPEGGRLVAILGRGASFDHVTAAPFWKAIKQRGASVAANIGLDGSNYSKYGTSFDNRLIIIDKAPSDQAPIGGEFKDLADAYDALRPVIENRVRPATPEVRSETPVGTGAISGSEVDRGELSEDQGGNGSGRRGRRGSGQPDVHAVEPGAGGDLAPTAKPELESGPVDAVTPSPADHVGADRTPERREPERIQLEARGKEDAEAVERQGAYQSYRPAKLKTGVSHQKATGTGLVETGAMGAVEPPDVSYQPHLPATVINSGHITDAQLEAIAYAGQAQSEVLADGKRAGFMVGDGTGVGKGTIAAGIALDNWNQGRRKILWLSLKPGLVRQAQRDLDWVEAPIKAKMLNDWDFSEPIDHEGVVFATYSMLHRVSGEQGGGSRLDQLVNWSPDVILMDESHAAKNAVAGGGDADEDEGSGKKVRLKGTTSKAGEAVLDLDNKLPDSRFTYFSATAFTDTKNLGYATRLGLWGPGTSFPNGFKDFLVQIDRGGMGAMELVAKEMKATGRYLARQISFDGVEYREVTAHLSGAQREMYDAAVNAWQTIFANIDKAIEALSGDDDKKSKGLAKMRATSQFWSTNQRFYRSLITAMKIPTVIEETEKALEKGNSVFLDLVSTGEAEAQRQLTKAAEENLTFEELDMSAKSMILNYLDKSFPTQLMEDYEDENGTIRSRPVVDEKGNPVESQEAVAIRDALKKDLDKIQLPQSPLDQMVEYFGPEAVAEVSGRKSRIVQDQKTGRAVEVQRVKPKGATAKDVNDWERQQFQSGKKRIAIASGAGGTGFDFHSDKRSPVEGQGRRTHVVLEPSWSADQQMQKFGRTHRTNQANAPEYVMIASDLGGEKRFISAIASRIASLGALTRGERKAGGGAAEMLAKYNLEGKYGEAATQAFFKGLAGGGAVLQDDVTVNLPKPPVELEEAGAMKVCKLLGVVKSTKDGPKVEIPPIKQFLNRVLNLPTDIQAATFNYFMDNFERIIQTVKDAGAFDEGTIELKAQAAHIAHREVIRTSENGTPTNHVTVAAEFPAEKNDWETAKHHVNQGDSSDYNQRQYAGLYRNKRSGKVWMARKSTKDITDQATGAVVPAMALLGPQAGSRQVLPVSQLADTSKFERIPNHEAEKNWNAALGELPDVEHQDIHLITGSVLPVWRQLAASGDGYKMEVVSIPESNGRSITGIRIPADQIASLKQSLSGSGEQSPGTILNRVWRQGERIQLRDASLTASRVMGERAIVVQPGKATGREILDKLGIPHIETASSVRYYLPYSDEPSAEQHADTLGKLTKILDAFPPKFEKTAAPATAEDSEQAALDRRRNSGQAGSIDSDLLTLGIPNFIKNDVAPKAKLAGEALLIAKDDILKCLAPAARGQQAKTTSLSVRKNAAELQRSTDRAEAALRIAGKYFDSQSDSDKLAFMDAVEHGRPQASPDLDRIASVMRTMLDTRRAAIQALGKGKLENFIENYFPHIWQSPKKAAETIANYSKRPLEGSKSFLKKRTIETIADGIAAGLTPVSMNPVELVLLKAREMDKYLTAHHILGDLKESGLLQFKRATADMPEVYAKINDKAATVWGTPSHAGALQIEGEWVAPEPAARVLNNYLSPGLRDKSALFRGFLGAGNLINQAQLGFSAFHAAFTTADAMISRFALGIYQTSKGDIGKGLLSMATTPLAPFTGLRKGDQMLKEWYAPGTQSSLIGEMVDAVVQAGGRAKMDSFYQTQISKKMMKAFRSGNIARILAGGVLRAPGALTELAAKPIMDWLVPRQKLAVFADLAQYELERLGTNASDPDVQAALARAWDSVDNRMGQLVYDNLAWHKITKDLAMLSVRSVGWNVGTIREVGGAGIDAAKFAAGKGDFTPKMSYAIALPIVAALAGAVAYYLWHGHAPEHLKDYYAVPDAKGHRWFLPTYMKDYYHYAVEPGRTLEGKVHPLLKLMLEMMTNRDYANRPIMNRHHPLVQRAEEMAAHVGKAYEPIALQADSKNKDKSPEERALPFFGITSAPKALQH